MELLAPFTKTTQCVLDLYFAVTPMPDENPFALLFTKEARFDMARLFQFVYWVEICKLITGSSNDW